MKNCLIFFLILSATFGISCKEEDTSVLYPPTIYGLPVDITDLPFTHAFEDKLFREYGELLDTPEGNNKLNFHPEFYLPVGYEIRAVADGVVSQIDVLDGNHDLNLMTQPDDAPKWRVAYEHVSNVKVEVGDRITVGQVIAEVSPFKQDLGKTALLIIHGVESRRKGGITSYCPFMLLDASVEAQLLSELQNHIQQWEINNGDVYNEEDWVEIGCAREKMTETEAQNP